MISRRLTIFGVAAFAIAALVLVVSSRAQDPFSLEFKAPPRELPNPGPLVLPKELPPAKPEVKKDAKKDVEPDFDPLTEKLGDLVELSATVDPVKVKRGKSVWVIAATHDTGIDFSEQNRTFIHKIDSKIDRERAKVVNDLLFTGLVRGLSLVERDLPSGLANATGDSLQTDGSIAVVEF